MDEDHARRVFTSLEEPLTQLQNESKPLRMAAFKKLSNTIETILKDKSIETQVKLKFLEFLSNYFQLLSKSAINDPSESCREHSLSILYKIFNFLLEELKKEENNNQRSQLEERLNVHSLEVAKEMIPSFSLLKISKSGKLEEIEEINQLFLQLLSIILSFLPTSFVESNFNSFNSIVKASSTDSFDDLRKFSAEVSVKILQNMNKSINLMNPTAQELEEIKHESKSVAVTFSNTLQSNLKHKKREVRQSSLEALRIFVFVGGENCLFQLGEKENGMNLIPILENLAFDSSQKIKEVLIQTLKDWMSKTPLFHFARKDLRLKVLPILLILCQDESSSIKMEAFQSLNFLSSQFGKEESDSLMEIESTNEFNLEEAEKLFKDLAIVQEIQNYKRVDPFSTFLVGIELKELIAITMEELQDWTLMSKQKSAAILFSSLFFSHSTFPTFMDSIFLLQLSISLHSEDPFTLRLIENSCLWIGFFINPKYYLPLLFPMLKGKAPKMKGESKLLSISDISRLSKLLNTFLRGFSQQHLEENSLSIIQCFKESIHRDSQMVDYKEAIITCKTLMERLNKTMKKEIESNLQDLLFELISLCRSQNEQESIQTTQQLINQLLKGRNSKEMEENLQKMLENVLSKLDSLSRVEIQLEPSQEKSLLFLLENLNTILNHLSSSPFFVEILPSFSSVLLKLLNSQIQVSIRQRILEILMEFTKKETTLIQNGEEQNYSEWVQISSTMLEILFKPFLVWSPGKQATILRKIALEGSLQIIQSMNFNSEVRKLIGKWIETQQSLEKKEFIELVVNLWDEEDLPLRTLSSQLIKIVLDSFQSLPLKLSEKNAQKIGEMSLKRMNDETDSLRILNAEIIPIFFKLNCGKEVEEIQKSLLQSLVLHLDDLNEKVQQQIHSSLSEIISNFKDSKWSSILKSNLEESKTKHRNPQKYVEPLLLQLSIE